VGEIDAGISKYLNADYHFQLDNSLAIRRHELQVVAGNDTISGAARYIYINDIAGTGFTEPRQQVEFGGKYRFREHWYTAADTLTDIGTLDPGLRKASFSINYADECFTFTAEAVRNLLRDQTGNNGTVVLFRVGFKNIGEFSAPSVQLTQTHDTNQP
jgi:LPS-assembly protein